MIDVVTKRYKELRGLIRSEEVRQEHWKLVDIPYWVAECEENIRLYNIRMDELEIIMERAGIEL